MQEAQILQAALQHFSEQTGLPIQQVNAEALPGNKRREADAAVDITIKGKSHLFLVEIKNELRQIHLPQIIGQLSREAEKWLLVCQYISKPNRALLKEKGINYLDASGNCNIQQNSLMVYVNDIPVTPQRQPQTGKLWKPAGLRLVFTLLQNSELINQPYRNIATESNIALGTVGSLLQELEAEGFMKTVQQAKRIENRETLLNRWMENLFSTLRPKLLRGKFRFVKPSDRDNWKNIPLKQAWWSGEPAGALLTGYLHPEKFTVYTNIQKTELIKQLHLMPDANGELEMLQPFWNTNVLPTDHAACVPTLLAYAELNSSFDSRNRETANRIKQQYHV